LRHGAGDVDVFLYVVDCDGEAMNLDNPIRMVRELKGAPLSILFALSVAHQRVSQAWLEGVTGYTDKPISSALAYLEEIGLADHTSSGWKLTGKAKQLPLPMEELEPRSLEEHEEEQDKIEEPEQEYNSDDSCQGRNNSTPLIITITDSVNEEEINSNNNNMGRKNSDSGVLDALARAGIMGKKRVSLAKLAWVTVESVSAWEAALKRRKKEKYSPGLLISVLESGDPAPVVKDERKDYLGKFAEFIEH
jgi:hypothetical protein